MTAAFLSSFTAAVIQDCGGDVQLSGECLYQSGTFLLGQIHPVLREGDVDFERNLIYFGRTKNRKLKVIPMNRAAREAVEWFLQNSKGKYLVSWPWGDPVGKTTVYDAFNRACHEAEIQNLHFHDLRHTAASYMVRMVSICLQSRKYSGTVRLI